MNAAALASTGSVAGFFFYARALCGVDKNPAPSLMRLLMEIEPQTSGMESGSLIT
jgi:hypothetical protein